MLLAGGAARRFGGIPKGLSVVKDVRIADRVLVALRGASDSQLVVSNDERAAGWFPSLPVVADETPGLGPLGGIQTALRAANGAAILLVAWDMPFVTAPLLRGMRALGEIMGTAVVPVHGDPPVIEALCAYYPADSTTTCAQLLAQGERRARALFGSLPGATSIPERVLSEHGDPARIFLSVDDPEQLDELGGQMPRVGPAPRR